MIKDAVNTYVEFDPKTGTVISVTSYPQGKNYIEVEYDRVKGIAEGSENPKYYKVEFNTTSLMYELINVHESKSFQYNVNESIYKVPNDTNADLILCKNNKTQKWQLKFGKLFSKTLKENDVTLQTVKHFSICKQNDPYQLYRTLTFNLASDSLDLQFDEKDAIITSYDVYTNKLFNSYGVVNEN